MVPRGAAEFARSAVGRLKISSMIALANSGGATASAPSGYESRAAALR